jgi:hypothetical protein
MLTTCWQGWPLVKRSGVIGVGVAEPRGVVSGVMLQPVTGGLISSSELCANPVPGHPHAAAAASIAKPASPMARESPFRMAASSSNGPAPSRRRQDAPVSKTRGLKIWSAQSRFGSTSAIKIRGRISGVARVQ